MFKKAIAVAVSAFTLLSVSVPFGSASALGYKKITQTTQQDGQLVFYSYNVPDNTTAFLKMTDDETSARKTYKFGDFYNHPRSYDLGKKCFSTMLGAMIRSNGGFGSAPSVDLRHSGGRYEKLRIKLSDYSSYFNSDGSKTKSVNHYGDHKFVFREEEPDQYGSIFSSVLCIFSGGAVNHVVPNSKGEVEIYVSAKIGEGVCFSTEFLHEIRKDGYSMGSGGGTSVSYLKGLTIGDSDSDGFVQVSDVTDIQRFSANMISFDAAQKRCADVNRDGVIDITDATELQVYLAR